MYRVLTVALSPSCSLLSLVAPARCRALHGEDVRRRVSVRDKLVDNSSVVERDDSSSSLL